MHSTHTHLSAVVVNVRIVHKLVMRLAWHIDGSETRSCLVHSKVLNIINSAEILCFHLLDSQVLCQLLLLTLQEVLLYVLHSVYPWAYLIPWLHVVLCCLCAVSESSRDSVSWKRLFKRDSKILKAQNFRTIQNFAMHQAGARLTPVNGAGQSHHQLMHTSHIDYQRAQIGIGGMHVSDDVTALCFFHTASFLQNNNLMRVSLPSMQLYR